MNELIFFQSILIYEEKPKKLLLNICSLSFLTSAIAAKNKSQVKSCSYLFAQKPIICAKTTL